MPLRIGLIGLPNVGKSTTFNALTQTQNAEVANYPFCTIKPNHAIVPLPDPRVEKIQSLIGVPNAIHATIEFMDIAGLVKGAHKGEGLGNQFLGNIRDVDVLVHVVRCFDDPNVVHTSAVIDPQEDIEVINIELALADLGQLERKIEKLTRQVKGDKNLLKVMDLAEALREHLQTGAPILTHPAAAGPDFDALNQEMRFLTGKKVIYAANVDEASLEGNRTYIQAVENYAARVGADVAVICARLEEEMVAFSPEERDEYLALAGLEQSGLELVLQKSFSALGLISFFTRNEKEVRAWTIPQGSTAPQSAGVIHTDFERGFIRAEVIPYEVFVQYGSDNAVKSAGAMRVEGKSYIVQDGDLIYFRFNV